MSMTNDKSGIITELKRLQNSHNGNPRWRITLDDGTMWMTATDSGWAYRLTDAWVGKYVVLLIDGRGRVWNGEEREAQRRISIQDRLYPPLRPEQDEHGHWPADPRMAVTVRSVYGGSTIVLDNATSYQDALKQALATPFEVWMADENRDDYGDA